MQTLFGACLEILGDGFGVSFSLLLLLTVLCCVISLGSDFALLLTSTLESPEVDELSPPLLMDLYTMDLFLLDSSLEEDEEIPCWERLRCQPTFFMILPTREEEERPES